jgi:hypothetical protein
LIFGYGCYFVGMSKKPGNSKVSREPAAGRFITLKDGRRLVSPPSGGEFRKSEIRKAVTAVVTERRTKAG